MWTELWGALRAEGLRDECDRDSAVCCSSEHLDLLLHVATLFQVRATVDYCGSLVVTAH